MNKKVIVALSVVILVIIGVLVYMMMRQEELTQYTVTFSYGNGTTREVDIEDGKVVSIPVEPTMKGYEFVGWEYNGILFDFSTPVTSNMTLVAKYEKIQEDNEDEEKEKTEFTVKFETDGGSTVVEQKIKEGEKVTKPQDPAKNGYIFKGWTLNGKEYNFTNAISANITLVALWEKIETVTVTFNTDGGSSVKAQTIEKGKLATKPTNPTKSGYRFKEWTLDGKAYNFSAKVDKNITLKAVWEKIETVIVTFDTDGGSSVKAQTVEKGKTATKPSEPTRTGYIFKGWEVNGSTYNFSAAVNSNITVKAVWEKIEYVTVTFDTDGGSSVKAQTVEKGKTATKPSDPTRTGYIFKGWEVNGSTYNFSAAVNSNITVKAVWEKIEYVTVTFDTDGGSSVKAQTVEKGKTATKPSDPTKTGYIFKGWGLNGATYNFSAAVNSNITVKAVWEKIETVTITFNTDGGSSVSAQTIEKGKTANKPSNPTKDGYTFAGWTLNGAAYNFSSAVNSNITLKASWNQKTYTAKVTKVDDYSTDRYITIYEEGTEIKVSGIYYTSGTRIPTAAAGNKLTVAAAEITGVTTIKVKLTSGSMVTATIQ